MMNLSISPKVACALSAVEEPNELPPSLVLRADVSLAAVFIDSTVNDAFKFTEVVSLALAPTWNFTLPSAPIRPLP